MGHWLIDPPLCGNFKRENDVLHSKPLFLWGCTILQITWDFVGYIILRGQTWHMFGMKPITMVQPAEKGYQPRFKQQTWEFHHQTRGSTWFNQQKRMHFFPVQNTILTSFQQCPCIYNLKRTSYELRFGYNWPSAFGWLQETQRWTKLVAEPQRFCHGGCPNFWLYSRHGNH